MRCFSYGGGPGGPLYRNSFSVSDLDDKKVGLTYINTGGSIQVEIRKFADLLPVRSSLRLETSGEVLSYFCQRIDRAKEIIEERNSSDKFNIVRSKYVLDAFEAGKKMLLEHLDKE